MRIAIDPKDFSQHIDRSNYSYTCSELLRLVRTESGVGCLDIGYTDIPEVMHELYERVGVQGTLEAIGDGIEFQLPGRTHLEDIEYRKSLAQWLKTQRNMVFVEVDDDAFVS